MCGAPYRTSGSKFRLPHWRSDLDTPTPSPMPRPQFPHLISKKKPALFKNRRSPDPGDQGTLFTFVGKETSEYPGLHLSARQLSESDESAAAIFAGVALATGFGLPPCNTQELRVLKSQRTKVPGAQLSRQGLRSHLAGCAGFFAGIMPVKAPSLIPSHIICLYFYPAAASGPHNLWVTGGAF